MNKLDKQFEQMMKGINIDSPSQGFSLKVMERIQAEVVVRKHSLVEDYQPVISKRTWIILFAVFIFLMVYITVSSPETTEIKEPGIWSAISGSLQKINTSGASGMWQSVTGLFASIPAMAYLILTASLALWTLDLFLSRFRHSTSEVQIG
ncbi:MAG: hypothetical protein K0M40_02880 [Prolixibacteraceae bacterium]|nr:hypothetical protein [Prolixibacteraceae bacterium]